jgi:HSP20 family molecular chaperone IbpA
MTTTTTLVPGHYASTERVYRQLPALFNDSWFNSLFGHELDKAFDVPNAIYPYNVKTIKNKDGELTDYVVEVALAGIGKNNIDIKVRDGYLYINVVKEEKTDECKNSCSYVKRGISTRKGQLSFLLNENANVKEIKSSYVDGLLRVTVPVTQPEVLNIDIKVD